MNVGEGFEEMLRGEVRGEVGEDTSTRALFAQISEHFVKLRRVSNEQLCRHKPLLLIVFLSSRYKSGTNA
jgi:hypothetical protein